MNLDTLKKRTARILTTPPEILYAISRHWAIIACCLVLGLILTASKVATDAVVYRGSATLIVSPQTSVLSTTNKQYKTHPTEVARFLNEQATILRSTTTIRKLVTELKIDNVMRQDENPQAKEYSGLRKYLNQAREKISEWKEFLESPRGIQDMGREVVEQRAIRGFLRRAKVEPLAKNNTIRMVVFGVNRDFLLREVNEWIRSYRARVEEMHKEGRAKFIDAQVEQYRLREENALKSITDYRDAHPDISKSAAEHLRDDIARWRAARDDIQTRLTFGDTVTPTLPEVPEIRNAKAEHLKRSIAELDAKIIELKSRKIPETSTVMQRYRNQQLLLTAELAAVGGDDTTATAAPADRRKILANNLILANEHVVGLLSKERALEEGLQELETLEDDYRRAREKRQSYQEMSEVEIDKIRAKFMVQIRVSDRPEVSTRPANTYPHRQVLIGSTAGFGIGLAVALLLEVLCGKIRYRSDVTHRFGVPVVGVIPKR